MADLPIEGLGNKTILDVAHKPNIDYMAKMGRSGIAKTVPDGMPPGSDVANMAIFGYDPEKYYTGRSPLEAVSMGVTMKDSDLAFRCNLITIGESGSPLKISDLPAEKLNILDHGSGHITTEEAKELIEFVADELKAEGFSFTPGVSYRHLLITENNYGKESVCIPPHDVIGQSVSDNLPSGAESEKLREMILKSYELLKRHPINLKRIEEGKNPGNCIWFWGQGNAPNFTNFFKKYGKNGSVISAVDLLKGIGISAGLNSIDVEGATGFIDTNYEGKVSAAINALKENDEDIVFIHVEAPDECGHMGDCKLKIKSVEDLDEKVAGPLLKYAKEEKEKSGQITKILIMPDHPTPIRYRTHTSDPVPFLIYSSEENKNEADDIEAYNETEATKGYYKTVFAPDLMDIMFENEK